MLCRRSSNVFACRPPEPVHLERARSLGLCERHHAGLQLPRQTDRQCLRGKLQCHGSARVPRPALVPVQTVLRSAASVASDAGSATGATLAASWATILPSTSATRASALFQRASSSPATSRLAGSAASYCRKARSVE